MRYYTIREAAAMLNLSVGTVEQYLHAMRIRHDRFNGSTWIPQTEIDLIRDQGIRPRQ